VGVKEFHIFPAVSQDCGEKAFKEFFRQEHIVFQMVEGRFGLYHPEFRNVARGVGIFRSESGTKGIYSGKGSGVTLRLKLPGYGQESPLAEKVFGKVRGFAGFRKGLEIQGGYLKHRPRAFGVAGGDYWSVNILKGEALEILVNRERQAVPNPGYRGEGIGPDP
jgi:hypothetical protein